MEKQFIRDYLTDNAVWSYFQNPDYYNEGDINNSVEDLYEDYIDSWITIAEYMKSLEVQNPDGYDLWGQP